jgi:endonuclease YncB( thermonuclease family)
MTLFDRHGLKTPFFSFNGISTLARVVDILDGDTLSVVVHLFDKYFKLKIRLADIDTCEIKSQNPDIRQKAYSARAKVLSLVLNTNIDYKHDMTRDEIQKLLDQGVYCVWIECKEFDKYGRVLCNVKKGVDDTCTFSSLLLKEHLAYVYSGKTKLDDKSLLAELK